MPGLSYFQPYPRPAKRKQVCFRLFLRPTFRIFDFVLDTSARQNASRLAFALGFFGIFGFALDTPARQNASRLAFALGFFGIFGFALDTPARQNAS
ncbi:hypothetical protein, partial [uncultured Alistipes sp.]|uniref:hypothetical protein n=1 Tax=uncultured Alistipes sp. TaxID=538949 RepID=UPI0026365762